MFYLVTGGVSMLFINSILIFIYLAFYILIVYPKKQYIQSMLAKMICMTIGMTSSLLIGLMAGVVLQGNFAISTIVAIVISFVIAFLIGSPFGSMASMEALCSSLMGAMMGAMVGEMLPSEGVNVLLFFMDSIFIVSMAYVFILIKKEEQKSNTLAPKRNPSFSVIFTIIIPILIIGAIHFIDNKGLQNQSEKIDHSQMHH
ncbi:hypothetical protein M3184_07525 [Metabacillus litoralis]|nr:hypothetical protein [Metabacillus litoralis]